MKNIGAFLCPVGWVNPNFLKKLAITSTYTTMNILDLSNCTPLRFGYTEQPASYDFEKPERLLALLKKPVVHPLLALLVDGYELEFYQYGRAEPVYSNGALLGYGIGDKEPTPMRVTLHPKLFLLCLRCPALLHDNQVHARELIRHLEAEILRRKLQLLIED
jgi:hypothetical protein